MTNDPNQPKPPPPRARGRRAPVCKELATELADLTKAEHVVLLWVSEGKRDSEIAIILGRSSRTIESHVAHILGKLGVETRTAAGRLLTDHHAASGTKTPRPGKTPRRPKPKG